MSNGTSSERAPSVDRLRGSVDDWLSGLGTAQEIGRLLARPPKEQQARGYAHTLREIAQQPVTWLGTAAAVASDRVRLDEVLERAGIHACTGSLVLTGSGSSLYAGECLALPLQAALRVPAQALPAGLLLTHPECLPPTGPYLVVSFARSGNSPESRAVLDSLLAGDVRGRHLVITCNRAGALATAPAARTSTRAGRRRWRAPRRASSSTKATPWPASPGAASAPRFTSAAAAGPDPPTRPVSRCWR